MSDDNFRIERIKKLLEELRYEVSRGMMEHEIDETLSYQFFVPVSRQIPNGVVMVRFETRPIPATSVPWQGGEYEPKLKIVK